MEDHLGNLWIGTDGGGLNKLDRRTGSFTYYRHDPKDATTIGSNAVWALLEDSQGSVWVGWLGRRARPLDPASGRVTRFRHDPTDPKSIANDHVWRILELQHRRAAGRHPRRRRPFRPEDEGLHARLGNAIRVLPTIPSSTALRRTGRATSGWWATPSLDISIAGRGTSNGIGTTLGIRRAWGPAGPRRCSSTAPGTCGWAPTED